LIIGKDEGVEFIKGDVEEPRKAEKQSPEDEPCTEE